MPDIELYDSDIDKIQRGPYAWMQAKQQTRMPLEDFRRGAIEEFAKAGFRADVRAYTTTEEGLYAFDVQIEGRLEDNHQFDYDRMAHEVRSNLLDLPGEDNTIIRADAELARIERKRQMGMLPKHRH